MSLYYFVPLQNTMKKYNNELVLVLSSPMKILFSTTSKANRDEEKREIYVYLEWVVSHFHTQRPKMAPVQGEPWFINEEVLSATDRAIAVELLNMKKSWSYPVEKNGNSYYVKEDKEILWMNTLMLIWSVVVMVAVVVVMSGSTSGGCDGWWW